MSQPTHYLADFSREGEPPRKPGPKELICTHPLFRYSARQGGRVVFVFERARYRTPSVEQKAKYQAARKIVERLGGHMDKLEFQCAGESPKLSTKDGQEILEAVQRDHPAVVLEWWNGPGHYTMSVAAIIAPERTA